MEIPKNVRRLAKDEGFPHVVYNGRWKENNLYVASDPKAPFVGPPQFILENGVDVRFASFEETEEIMSTRK